MMVRDIVDVEGSITSSMFSMTHLKGNQRWVYRDESIDYGFIGNTYFLTGGYILQVVPLFDVRVNGISGRFKALMIYIIDSQGDKIDEEVYLTDGDEPGKSIPRYVIRQSELQS